MPDWLFQFANTPLAAGLAAGFLFIGALRVELRSLKEKNKDTHQTALRAHVRIDDHIKYHMKGGADA